MTLTESPKESGFLYNINVGAGSTEQGEASQIGSPWMRTECFLQPDGSYDWDKQQGQRNFLRLAKERGVNKFLAFLNSPPVYFTQNGLATNTGRDGTLNLKAEHYDSSCDIYPFPTIVSNTCSCLLLVKSGFFVGAYTEGALGIPAIIVHSFKSISLGSLSK